MRQVSFRFSEQDRARVDELRPDKCSRTEFLRILIRKADPTSGVATHSEALELLSESARCGVVQAQVALERALRTSMKKEDDVSDAIDRILAS